MEDNYEHYSCNRPSTDPALIMAFMLSNDITYCKTWCCVMTVRSCREFKARALKAKRIVTVFSQSTQMAGDEYLKWGACAKCPRGL